ncbi:MAG: MFS transporter [Trueperaceae bacterium]
MLLAIYLPATLLAICDGLLIPTLPVFVESLGAGLAVVGLVLAAEGLGTLLSDVPAGHVVNGMRPRPAMLLGIGIVTVAALASALAPSLAWLFFFRLLSGAGLSVWNVSRHAFLAGATSSANRGRTMGVFGGVTRLGGFLGPAIGGLLASAVGLRAPFLLYALVGAGTMVLLASILPPDAMRTPAHRTADGWGERKARRAALAASRGKLLNAGGAQLLGQAVRAGRRVLVPLYAAQVLGLDVGVAGLIVSVSSLADMSLFYPAGLIMDRLGRKFAIVPSFVVQALGMALVPLSGGAFGLGAAAVLMGVGNGLSAGTMMTLGADLAPRGAVAAFLGRWRLVGDAGFVAGPLVVGLVAQQLGLGTSALAVAAIGAGAASWFAFGVPETLKRQPAEAAVTPPK